MRRRFELILGLFLLAVLFIGIPTEWKIYASMAVAFLLTLAGLIRPASDSSKDAVFVEKGPPLEKPEKIEPPPVS